MIYFRKLMLVILFSVLCFSSAIGAIDPACDASSLNRRVAQFFLPLADRPMVDRTWFTAEAQSNLHLWNPLMYYRTQIEYQRERQGVVGFVIVSRRVRKDAETAKVRLDFGDKSSVVEQHVWVCEGGSWKVSAEMPAAQ